MKKTALLLFLFVACLLMADTFSVQGVLRDPLGKTVEDGYYSLTFKLYNEETGGDELWEETHESVLIGNGVYLVELGSVASLDGVPFNENYWIGMSVNGGNEMEPRIKMTKSPAAMSVFGVDNVFPSTGFVGVGTHEPEANLHIQATDEDSDRILFTDTEGSTTMVMKPDGKIGINNAQPAEALDITGNLKMRAGSILFDDGSALNSANFGGAASSVTNYGTAFINADSDNDGVGDIEFRSGETSVMNITPEMAVDVYADTVSILTAKINIGHKNPYYWNDIDIRDRSVCLWDGLIASYPHFATSERELYVQGDIETHKHLCVYTENTSQEVGIFLSTAAPYSATWGIGRDLEGESVDFYWASSQLVASINQYGEYIDQYVYQRNRDTSESYTEILEKVKDLNPIRYNYENDVDLSKKHIGFKREDVQRLFPELVYENKDGIGINTSGYGIVAISAVKELNEKVEEQDKKIEELEKALAALMQEVKNLKN